MDKPELDKILENELTRMETRVLKLFLAGKSDTQIAEELYIGKATARSHLCNTCQKFGLKDGIDNREHLICLFIRYKGEWVAPSRGGLIEEPNGRVPLNSYFYVSRDDITSEYSREIQRAGALIRIKAPQLMGKSSLVSRIMDEAQNRLSYRTVEIDLTCADQKLLHDSESFLKWLCINLGKKLELSNQLDNYWDNSSGGSILNCTDYFEKYLLPKLDSPLVLALDKVDRLFPYPIAYDFFPLLRIFHENAKLQPIWEKLRLIIVHSTEVYVKLKAENSPFENVGYVIQLRDFTPEEVKILFIGHELPWQNFQVEKLMQLVGGHPYLVRLALYQLKTKSESLEQLLKKAPTEAGVYNEHLRKILRELRQEERLIIAYKKVIKNAPNAVYLDPMDIFLLHSLGLVIKRGSEVVSRCNLYQQYFLGVL